MTYSSLELAQYSGSPVELFDFTEGASGRYTSAEKTFTYLGNAYTPLGGLSRSALEFSQEAISQNVKIRLPIGNAIAAAFIADTLVRAAKVKIYRFHRGAASDVVQYFPGVVVSHEVTPQGCILTCAPVTSDPDRRFPTMRWQGPCNRVLYGPGCDVVRADFKTTTTLTAVTGNTIESTDFGAEVDQWFRAGYVELASGARRGIDDHVGNVITLDAPFPGLTPGTSVDAYAGCDHLKPTCDTKFDNLLKHAGFHLIPNRNPFHLAIV